MSEKEKRYITYITRSSLNFQRSACKMINSVKAPAHTAARCYESFLKVGSVAHNRTLPPVSHTEMLVAKLINEYLTQEGSDYFSCMLSASEYRLISSQG